MSDDVLDIADRTWRRLGVPGPDRAGLRAELAADLAAAAADGRSALDYVGGDPAGLARAWAAGRGLVRPRLRLGRTTAAGLVAMLPGAGFGLLIVIGPSSMFLNDLLLRDRGEQMVNPESSGISFTYAVDPPLWSLLVWYVLAGLFAYGGALAAVSAVLQSAGDVARRPTVRALMWTLPIASVPATAAGVAVAGALGYGDSGSDLVAIAVVVLAVVGAVLLATRATAVLRLRRTPA